MLSAIYCVPFIPGQGAQLPPMDAEDDSLHLSYLDAEGVRRGGHSMIGQVPNAQTCLVRVWSDADTLDALAALPDCLFVEDVPEEDLTPTRVVAASDDPAEALRTAVVMTAMAQRTRKAMRANDKPADPKPKRAKPTKAKLDAFLKAHGHKAADVDKQTGADVTTDLLALHGVTAERWRGAGGA